MIKIGKRIPFWDIELGFTEDVKLCKMDNRKCKNKIKKSKGTIFFEM